MTTTATNVLKNYIDGEWVDAKTDQFQPVPNPATGEEIAQVPISTKADVEWAVQVAKDAYKSWSQVPVPKRARILFKYQQLLVDHWDELAKLITEENGKAIKKRMEKFSEASSALSSQLARRV